MELTDKAEEILEILWVQLVEKEKTGYPAASIDDGEGLRVLEEGEFVHTADGTVTLTETGREEARGCVRRHRLAERLMVDVLDLKTQLVHDTSCSFEHLLHKGLDNDICTLLGHPTTCPHGQPIPDGECCRTAREQVEKLVLPLSELECGFGAQVAYLRTDDREALQKIIAMGVLPGTRLLVKQRSPTILFEAGNSQFAIDHGLASKIIVRRVGDDDTPAPERPAGPGLGRRRRRGWFGRGKGRGHHGGNGQ